MKTKINIFGISIWKIFSYFIIYSFLGYIIETIFAIITMGVFQSRQSFMYGPFCGIYGIAATIIILFSKYFNKNIYTLFIYGFLIGTIIEYFISFFTEIFLDIQWWDYSNNVFNLNGRVCLTYSLFWGILSVLLIKYFNPCLDRIMIKITQIIPYEFIKKILLFIIIFIFIDCIITCFAQDIFITRILVENNIESNDIKRRKANYDKIKENKFLSKIIDIYFNDEKMIKTFPNIKVKDKNDNIIYIDSLIKEINPYYIKIYEK